MTLGLPPRNIEPSNYVGIGSNVITVITAKREPTTTDVNYPLFTEWRVGKNPTSGVEGDFWKLLNFVAGSAIWEKISGATASPIQTLTPDTGADIEASAQGNVIVKGQDPASINGIETYTISANEMGVRMKTPFFGNFEFTSSDSAFVETLTVSNSSDTNSSQARVVISVAGASADNPVLQWLVTGVTRWTAGIHNSDADAWILSQGLTLGTNNVMRVDPTKVINYPGQARLNAAKSAPTANATGNGDAYGLVFDTVTTNIPTGSYNNTTGIFTCPIAGQYLVTSQVIYSNIGAAHTDGYLGIVSGSDAASVIFNPYSSSNSAGVCTMSVSKIMNLGTSTTVSILTSVAGGTKVVGVDGGNEYTYLTIWLLG